MKKIINSINVIKDVFYPKNIFALTVSIFMLFSCSKSIEMPATRQVAHYDEYHGTQVLDSYRWLEDFTSDETKEWVEEQNLYTKSFLTNAFRNDIRQDLESIWTSEYLSTPFTVQNKTFYY